MHHGKDSRIVPLFPRLHTILLEAFEQAEPGDEHVITRYRDSRSNLRTHAHRIIERAGLTPWQKVFQNCRGSLETELSEDFPIQTVVAWLGNTPAIAMKHYLQVTEKHLQKAVQNPVHFSVQNPAAQGSRDSCENSESDVNPVDRETMQNDATPCKNKELHQAPGRTRTENSKPIY